MSACRGVGEGAPCCSELGYHDLIWSALRPSYISKTEAKICAVQVLWATYNVCKAAIIHLSCIQACKGQTRGLNANCISPGVTRRVLLDVSACVYSTAGMPYTLSMGIFTMSILHSSTASPMTIDSAVPLQSLRMRICLAYGHIQQCSKCAIVYSGELASLRICGHIHSQDTNTAMAIVSVF